MPAKWTGTIKGELHNEGFTVKELAKEANLNCKYVSQVLHAERPSDNAREKLWRALQRLKDRRHSPV